MTSIGQSIGQIIGACSFHRHNRNARVRRTWTQYRSGGINFRIIIQITINHWTDPVCHLVEKEMVCVKWWLLYPFHLTIQRNVGRQRRTIARYEINWVAHIERYLLLFYFIIFNCFSLEFIGIVPNGNVRLIVLNKVYKYRYVIAYR